MLYLVVPLRNGLSIAILPMRKRSISSVYDHRHPSHNCLDSIIIIIFSPHERFEDETWCAHGNLYLYQRNFDVSVAFAATALSSLFSSLKYTTYMYMYKNKKGTQHMRTRIIVAVSAGS